MEVIHPADLFRVLDGRDLEVYDHRFRGAAHNDRRKLLGRIRIDLLMWDIGWHEDEVAGSCVGHEFKLVAPAHPRAAADHVDHALQRPVMVGAGLRPGMDYDRSGP